MEGILRTLRWTLAVRALLVIAIGAACLVRPWGTIEWLVLVFGGYAIAEGILTLAAAAVLRWSTLLVQAIVSLGLGILAVAIPGQIATFAVIVLGGWGLVVGVLQLAAAMRLRELLAGEWMFALAGIVTAVVGLAFVAQPSARLVGLMWLAGSWALVTGVVMLGVVWRLTRTSIRM